MGDLPTSGDAKNATKQGTKPSEPPHLESSADYKEPFSKRLKRYCNRNLHKAPVYVEAICALALVVITGTYTYYAGGQLKQARKATEATQIAANAAKSAADTAAKQLELSERPYVSAPQIALNGPLTFNVNGASVELKLEILNTGHSPAFMATPSVLPVVGFKGGLQRAHDSLKQACDGAIRSVKQFPDSHVALFPNQPFVQEMRIGIAKEDLDRASEEFPNRDEFSFPALTVCIGYTSTFNETSAYYTGYTLDLFKVDALNRLSTDFKRAEDVDVRHLRLQLHPMNAIIAD